MAAMPMRSFSIAKPTGEAATKVDDQSIFASADYFKDVKPDEEFMTTTTDTVSTDAIDSS